MIDINSIKDFKSIAKCFDDNIDSFENHITNICNALKLKVQFGEKVIYIFSGITHWRLYLKNDNTIDYVVHENYRFKRSSNFKEHKLNCGFHKQKLYSVQVEKVLDYIYKHDQSFLRHKCLA